MKLSEILELADPQIAWAAGLFEGEGCFTTGTWSQFYKLEDKRYKKSILRIKLAMTDKDVLDTFVEIVKEGNVKGPYKHPNPKAKPLYEWSLSGKVAQKVIDLLSPYMHSRRKNQIKSSALRCTEYNRQVEKRRKLHKFGPHCND